MAQVKFEKIISCSSEDPDFPAKNILTCGEVPGAWKTAKEGESQGTVVIQLDRKYKISQLEIKNEASAFIEVLVANQDENEEAKFQVLLSVSSFMTPNESKNLSNVNRLRVFAKDKLSPSALKQSFDLVKINCTQPFNKTIKYGISYIKIMEGDADDSSSPISSALSIKNRVNDNKDDNTPVSPPTKDSSPRAGTAPVDTLSMPNVKDDSSPSPNKKVKVATRTLDKPSTSRDQDKRNAKPKEKKTKVDQPFCQLMKGVTFTISGFQNPLRSEIRSKGLQMGAKYKGDWDRSCTHLICAFPNTPKFNQVNGTGGKIVTKEWIEESYDQRKLLPWKKYSLVDGGRASKKSSSEDEDDGEMDDFIVDDDEDEDEEEEYDPKTKNELEDEDEDVNELGPVLPQKLRDNSPQRPKQPTLINSPLQNKSPKDNKVDKVKAKNNIKDEDYNSDDIYDAATDED
ncbi:DNA repair protein XRCC1 [Tetranychus urticae]|uniref:BRCT domain-containing protein n=1 Tax=Tetranychus urticae TaxID=32264 RepID=T1KR16_TETUR|nr:DNA repair protein XRCC1 [Tetranychus urticae]